MDVYDIKEVDTGTASLKGTVTMDAVGEDVIPSNVMDRSYGVKIEPASTSQEIVIESITSDEKTLQK